MLGHKKQLYKIIKVNAACLGFMYNVHVHGTRKPCLTVCFLFPLYCTAPCYVKCCVDFCQCALLHITFFFTLIIYNVHVHTTFRSMGICICNSCCFFCFFYSFIQKKSILMLIFTPLPICCYSEFREGEGEYRKGTSIRQAPVFRHLRALWKSPRKFIIWINEL